LGWYFEVHVDQFRPMMREYFRTDYAGIEVIPGMIAKKGILGVPYKGLKAVNDFVNQITWYGDIDRVARQAVFTSQYAVNKTALDGIDLKNVNDRTKALKRTNYFDMDFGLQQIAIGKLLTEGIDSFALYTAEEATVRTHFMYSRWQKGRVSQGPMGSALLNLFTFAKGRSQRIVKDLLKVADISGLYTKQDKMRAINDFVQETMWAGTVGAIVAIVGGRMNPWKDREKDDDRGYGFRNPYNALLDITYTFGGLGTAVASQMSTLRYHSLNALLYGDRRSADRLPYLISNAGNIVIPFYEQALDMWEALFETKNIDMQQFRKFRDLVDKEYKKAGKSRYKMKREWYEWFQKAVMSAEVGELVKKSSPSKVMRSIRKVRKSR